MELWNVDSTTGAEDDAYFIFASCQEGRQAADVLNCCAHIAEPEHIADVVAAMKPRCKVPSEALDVIFGSHVERSSTSFLRPRPIHAAVMRSAARLAHMLLAVSNREGLLEESLQKGSVDTF